MTKRELTDRQKKFLEVLFDQAGGDAVQAKLLAGYSENSSTSDIVASMKEEIMEATQLYRLSASKELLDRVGLIKTEKVQVEASGGVMIMPPKKAVVKE